MKTVLCFGDSNTWGFIPESITSPFSERHAHDVRWTGVLARELGDGFHVIEEGQNGRTTVHDDPFAAARNGKTVLPALLESHKPLDLVVMMLGTNDLKAVFGVSPGEIASGVKVLAQMILSSDAGRNAKPPKLLILCPPAIGQMNHLPDIVARLPHAFKDSRELPRHYESLASSLGCAYLNTQTLISTGSDGIHLDASAHATLGKAVATVVKSLLPPDA
ncbi:MAG: SGNH/GDSL hydrolase family protein [Verrucomicrobiaceae bacterium]|nr:SGNH/GDSL hydrolase family protein [Verrucomicrobiaceae bacterium]